MADNIVQFVLKLQSQGFTKPADDAKKAADGLKQSQDTLNTSTAELGQQAGKTAEGMARLASAVSVVSPAAGAAVGDVAKAAGAFRSAADAAGAFGVELGVLGPVTAVLAGALVVLGANLAYDAQQASAAEDAHRALEAAIKDTTKVVGDNDDALVRLRASVGQISQADADLAITTRKVNAEYEAQVAAVEKAIEARKAEGGEWGRDVQALRSQIEERKKARDEQLLLAQATAEWAQARADSDAYVEERDKRAKAAADALAQSQRDLAAAARDGAAALAEGTANSDTAAALAAQKAQLDGYAAARRAITDLRLGNAAMVTAQLDGIARVNAAEQDALAANAVAEARALAAFEGTQAQRLALVADYEKRATLISAQAEQDRAAAAIEAQRTAIQRVRGWTSSPVSSLSNMPGPVGWVFSLLDMFSKFKQTISGINSFEKGILDTLETGGAALSRQFLRSIERGSEFIKAAPHLIQGLVDGLPALVQGLAGQIGPVTSALLDGLVVGGPRIAGSIITGLLDPNAWIELGRALWDGFARGFASLGNSISSGVESVGSYWSSEAQTSRRTAALTTGHRSGADYVAADGWRFVHRGERIDTASQVSRSEGGSSGGGGGGRVRMGGRGGFVTFEVDTNTFVAAYTDLRRRGAL